MIIECNRATSLPRSIPTLESCLTRSSHCKKAKTMTYKNAASKTHIAYMAQAKWTAPLITKHLRRPRYLGVSNADAAISESDDTPLTRKAPLQEVRNDHRT